MKDFIVPGTPDGLTVTARPRNPHGFPFRAECTAPYCCGPHLESMVWLAASHDELVDHVYPRYAQHLRDMAAYEVSEAGVGGAGAGAGGPTGMAGPPAGVSRRRHYATAQHIGTRSHQCDATAVYTTPNGTRAYALLDGIGSSDTVREWTRHAARKVARAAAKHGDAETGLRAVYDRYAAEPERQDVFSLEGLPAAAAVVAVTAPGRPLTVAWCGDSRAYLLHGGIARRLTEDHNLRRVFPPTATYPRGGSRNLITSCLGSPETDLEVWDRNGHIAIETTTVNDAGPYRLVLASDGAYEPSEDNRFDLYAELADDQPRTVARCFVDNAVVTSIAFGDHGSADNATALVADITP